MLDTSLTSNIKNRKSTTETPTIVSSLQTMLSEVKSTNAACWFSKYKYVKLMYQSF